MKSSKIFVLALFLTIFGATTSRAQGLGNLLGGDLGGTIGNLLEGVFSSSNITIADMAGEWNATGPAVCFQGEGFLKQAGGQAAAAAIETKLAPYYEQYGLNNAKLTIDETGNFTLACKSITLKGTITQAAGAQPGVFDFNFTVLGKKVAGVTTYVQKTSTTMDVMFDATKLKGLISTIANITGISIVKTISGVLDSYDGLCVGFNFKGHSTNSGLGTGSGNGLNIGNLLNGFGSGSTKGDNSQNGVETETQTEAESEATEGET